MKSKICTNKLNSPRPFPKERGPTLPSAALLRKITCCALFGSALAGVPLTRANVSTVTIPVSKSRVTYALLANPYLRGGNTVAEVFSSTTGLPSGTVVYKYTTGQGNYGTSTFTGAWSNPNLILNPGEGFFLSFSSEVAGAGTSVQVNFSGDTVSSIALPAGGQYGLIGSPIDKAGSLVHDLGYPVTEGDYIYKFNVGSQSYVSDSFVDGEWDSGSEPRLGVGEGFFVVRQRVADLSSQWAGSVSLAPGQCLSAMPLGSSGADYGQTVAVDPSGNVLIGGSIGTYPFVAKRSASGSVLWSLAFSGPGSGSVQAVAADSSGNVLITGNFGGTLDFGGDRLVSAGGYDIFVAKFSPSGAHLWSKRFGTTSVNSFLMESGFGLAVDMNNNAVLITGVFNGAVDFGGGTLTSVSGQDLFLTRLSADGSHVWSKRVGGAGATTGNGIVVDASGNAFLTGCFARSVDFGLGLVTARGASDMFIAKYSAGGANLWMKSFGTNAPITASSVGNALALDRSGNVVVTGTYQAAMSVGGQALAYSGYNDIFLAKYSGSNGSHLWSRAFGGANMDMANSVAVDSTGNITVTGQMGSRLDFGEGALSGVSGSINIYMANFATDGTPRWSQSMGVGLGNVRSAAANSAGHWFLTGCFTGSAKFSCGTLTSAGGSDIFLAEFAP